MAHFYSICSIFSYAGVMTADMGWAADRDSAGYVAGMLQSANVIGRIPSSSLWGCFVGRYGLKRGICLSVASLALGNLLFGLCAGSLELALAVRFVFLGLGNGWATFLGPVGMEIGGHERQTEVVGKVLCGGAFIQLLGPAIGGWTYGIFPGFPAMLPGIVGSAICLCALLALCLWMPSQQVETSTSKRDSSAELSVTKVLCTSPLPLSILLRAVQGGLMFAFFEVVPLWAITSTELGGLALLEDDVGLILGISAAGTGLAMVFVLPRITTRLGLRLSIILTNLVVSACFILMTLFPGLVTVTIFHGCMGSGFGMVGAGYVVCTNKITPPEHRAAVNGVSVTFESLFKGVAPVLSSVSYAGSLSAWGQTGHYVTFAGLACGCAFLALGTWFLHGVDEPPSTPKTKSFPTSAKSHSLPLSVTVGNAICTGGSVDKSGLASSRGSETVDAAVEISSESSPGEEKMDAVSSGCGSAEHTKKKKGAKKAIELEPLNRSVEGV
eukprot:CAMPEP_0117535942 /NCGR_PEP_ID=MMETSP0784-20121206/41193_1 /TAXON_ID=39447 /ORGANISM="" /LENGTH=497 /DNA_ID=CAMNT_0005332481 /DNA_START=132 /DNA_END=1625 /DNA_ORIENTATION=+